MNKPHNERGQALVLIALAMLGMIAFAALAIDGGMLYAEHRNTQNIADSAAISAAMAQCTGKNAEASARAMLAANGFSEGPNATVTIHTPPLSGPYAGQANYHEVVITMRLRPIFSSFLVPSNGLATTTRAVGFCQPPGTGGATRPGLGGEISMLALSETAANGFTNTGASTVIVDGGVYINSNAQQAFNQTGSATLYMNWMQVRGGAQASGAFGINSAGTGQATKQIVVGGNFNSNGSGTGNSGAYFIGGNVTNGGSVALRGDILQVGGAISNSGAGGIIYTGNIQVNGGIDNSGSGNISGASIFTGGNVTASGAAPITATGPTGLRIGGNVNLSGSARITGKVTIPPTSTIKITGGASMPGPVTRATVGSTNVAVNVPVMADPLATVLNPPTLPTGSCTPLTIQNWGPTQKLNLTSGSYYCQFNIGGSAKVIIPPGTYWVDKFSLSGSSTAQMDGVNLYITGKGLAANTAAFDMGGSTSLSAAGSMIYIRNGSFSVNGAAGFKWSAPGSGPYQGLALYLDRQNAGSFASQTGSTNVTAESGTWYAPASACTFGGATGTIVKSQFICSTIAVHGSSELRIQYDGSLVYQVTSESGPSSVSLME